MELAVRECEEELRTVEARFRALVAEWRLGRHQVAGLLGTDVDALGADLVPTRPGAAVERRLRLLIDFRGMLDALVGDGGDVPAILREEDPDAAPGAAPACLLSFLMGPVEHLVAARTALHARLEASRGRRT